MLRITEMAMTQLQTARMTLTPSTPADCDDFIALEQDPDVMRLLNGGKPVDRATVTPDAGFFMPTGNESDVWTARDKAGGAFVGWFCLWPEGDALAELGYRLRRAAWGRGLATEGATALVDWGFSDRHYERIVATTMAINLGSRRVMEKLGMHHLSTEDGEWADPIPGSEQGEVWYELPRADWKGV